MAESQEIILETPEEKEIRECVVTKEMLERSMPTGKRGVITQEFVKKFNGALQKSEIREELRENFLSYTSILGDGRFKIEDYLNAVHYVSYKLRGDTNVVAWTKTFPDRYNRMMLDGTLERDLDKRVNTYNKGQLVNKILEQSLVPSWIINQDIYQKAVNHLARLMTTARSEKVQADSASALLTHLKMPETAKVRVDVNMKADESISELRKTTMELVLQQKKAIESGAMTPKEIAHSRVIQGEIEDADISE